MKQAAFDVTITLVFFVIVNNINKFILGRQAAWFISLAAVQVTSTNRNSLKYYINFLPIKENILLKLYRLYYIVCPQTAQFFQGLQRNYFSLLSPCFNSLSLSYFSSYKLIIKNPLYWCMVSVSQHLNGRPDDIAL